MYYPFISIIIPVYNVESYIEKCLLSVMHQSFKGKLECVIIDDCGQDESIVKADNIIARESKNNGNLLFRVLHHKENRGLSAARNTGLCAANGEYVFFLDSDDWLDQEAIQNLVNVLIQYPASQIVQAGVMKSDGNVFGQDLRFSHLPDYIDDPVSAKSLILKRDVPCMAFPRLIKKDFLIKNDLFFHEGYLNEDEIWRFYLAKKIERISLCRCNVYVYNVREGSIMTTVSKKRWESVIAICNEMIDNIDSICKKEQVSMIAHILQDAYLYSADDDFKEKCLLSIHRLKSYSPKYLQIKLFLFEKLIKTSIRQTRIGASFFSKIAIVEDIQ